MNPKIDLLAAMAVEREVWRSAYEHRTFGTQWECFWHKKVPGFPAWNVVYPLTTSAIPTWEEAKMIFAHYEAVGCEPHLADINNQFEAHAISEDNYLAHEGALYAALFARNHFECRETNDLPLFCQVVKDGFDLYDELATDVREQLERVGRDMNLRNFLVTCDGQVAGAGSSALTKDGISYFMNGTVLRRYQNRGFPAQLVQAMLLAVKTPAVTRTGHPVFYARVLPKLGFRDLGKVSFVPLRHLVENPY